MSLEIKVMQLKLLPALTNYIVNEEKKTAMLFYHNPADWKNLS